MSIGLRESKKINIRYNLLVTYVQSFLILFPELHDFKGLEFLLTKYISNPTDLLAHFQN